MNRFVRYALIAAGIGVGTFLGYRVATDDAVRARLRLDVRDVVSASRKKVSQVSEDVVLKTAQLTKNPQVNQDWVENQWDALGL